MTVRFEADASGEAGNVLEGGSAEVVQLNPQAVQKQTAPRA